MSDDKTVNGNIFLVNSLTFLFIIPNQSDKNENLFQNADSGAQLDRISVLSSLLP